MILILGAMMSGSYDILRLAGLISEVSDILMEVDFSKGEMNICDLFLLA